MDVQQAIFVKSSDDYRKCPDPALPEYAFIGRSNVGKSSLINMIANRTGLAKTSSTPGKTRLINHFLVNQAWYLADLPGYGYAKASKSVRKAFPELISAYLSNRRNLLCTFLLIDSRHPPQQIDLNFMEWMATHELPFTILFTKSDKLSRTALWQRLTAYKEHLMQYWEELPPSIVTSSLNGLGKEEILRFIAETNGIFDPDRVW